MYRFLRSLHKIAGLIGSLFLVLIAVTGFLLALKGRFEQIRPPTQKGTEIADRSGVISPYQAFQSAQALNLPTLKSFDDIDRLEYQVGKNVYKILTTNGYDEVQIDGSTGKVLSTGKRNDQLAEDIHDLSYFHPVLRETVAPVVAVILFTLGVSGIVMYFVPIVRRRRFSKEQRAARPTSDK